MKVFGVRVLWQGGARSHKLGYKVGKYGCKFHKLQF